MAGLLDTVIDWMTSAQRTQQMQGLGNNIKQGLLGIQNAANVTNQAARDTLRTGQLRPNTPAQTALENQMIAAGINLGPGSIKFEYPQAQALETARKNAVKMLGLPENNTALDRARAMGFEDGNVHFSRHGIDTNVLDSGQYATAPFDAVGTHVGIPDAALDRFKNTVKTTDQIKGSTYPLMIKKGEQFISPETGGAWSEDALNAALFDRGGYATARETFPSLNSKLRKDLFKGSGYDSIPYVNDVESKGAVSYIVPPWNIRSRFAAFDPARVNESDLLGAATPEMMGLLGLGTLGGLGAYEALRDR